MLVLLTLAFTACEEGGGGGNEEPNNQKPILTCTSESTLEFSAAGGQGKITYTLKNANAETALTITENAEWIDNPALIKAGEIAFTVKPNTGDARSSTILVSYGSASFPVKVNQAAGGNEEPDPTPNPGGYDVEKSLPIAFGEYYGNEYSSAYNYYLVLSDNGVDEDSYLYPNSVYYYLDIYANQAPANDSKIQVPAGTYTFDASDSAAAGTMGNYYSFYSYTDDEQAYDTPFVSATLEVKSNGAMDLVVTLESGETHHITFSGDYSLNGGEGGEGGEGGSGTDDGYYSSLTDNYSLNLSGTPGYAEWYGDYYDCGMGNWYILLEKEDGTGDCLVLDLLKEGLTYTGDPSGTYPVALSSLDSNGFIPGYLENYEGEEYFMGCWLVNYDKEAIAPFANGTVTITKSGSNYTISVNCTDDNSYAPNTISGSWTGSLSTSDESQSYSASSRSSKSRKAIERAPKRQFAALRLDLRK